MSKSSRRILTWAPNWSRRGNGGRWKKQVDGKVHFFGHAKNRDDAAGYRAAERNYLDFLGKQKATKPVQIPASKAVLADICEKFLQDLEARYERDEIGADYFEQCRGGLNEFVLYVGGETHFSDVSELALEDYRSHSLAQPISAATGCPISLRSAKDRLAVVKTLYRWAYKLRLCDNLPRNLQDYTRYPWPTPEVKVFTMDEIEKLWEASPRRLRCWMALALNCGMGQSDISDLKSGEIDFVNGYIERERTKTGVKAKYKLWKVTQGLLEELKRQPVLGSDRFFLTDEGNPLVERKLVEGKLAKNDAIKCSFWRVQRKTEIDDGRGFYCLRKTGATQIESIDPAVTEMYLAHAENGQKKSYAQRDWARLEQALLLMESKMPLGP